MATCRITGCHGGTKGAMPLCNDHQPPLCVCVEPLTPTTWGECLYCRRKVMRGNANDVRLTEWWQRVLRAG